MVQHGSTCFILVCKKLSIPNSSNMEFLDQTAKDPEVAKMFEVMGRFFSVRGANQRGDQYPIPDEEEDDVEGGDEDWEGEGGESDEDFEHEPVVDPDNFTTPIKDTSHTEQLAPCTPGSVKRSVSFDDDPFNELLAWRMGGNSMVKPTPSPQSPWGKSPFSEPAAPPVELETDESDDLKAIALELARVEYLIFIIPGNHITIRSTNMFLDDHPFGVFTLLVGTIFVRHLMAQKKLKLLKEKAESSWNDPSGVVSNLG